MELKWQINDVKGVSELKEVTRIGVTVDGSLKKAEAVMKFAVADKMFFNGYQTWYGFFSSSFYFSFLLHNILCLIIKKNSSDFSF